MAGKPLVQVDETAPLRPDSPALYCATKARAEQAVLDANSDGFETVVVRPRFVWGAGDTTLLPVIVAMVRAGRFAWIGGGRHRTSTTHVENTVEGLVLGAKRGRPGNAYFVTDGEPVVFREFIERLLSTQGVDAPSRSLPAACRRGARDRRRGRLATVAASGSAAADPFQPTGSHPRSARSGSTRRASSSAISRSRASRTVSPR